MSFVIGSVVSLSSNGLLKLEEYDFINLGGIESFSIPLMVITEVLHNTREEINDQTGKAKKSPKGKEKYKCVYFSDVSMKLEENWFHENELVKYDSTNKTLHKNPAESSIKWGDVVRFKTVDEEARKKKSYNDTFGQSKGKSNKPLLTYTSPAFLVVGFTNVDNKEPLIDPYNGKIKRTKSSKIVKCKFFVTSSNKFSEQLIPIECLQKIDNSKIDQRLETVNEVIISKVDLILTNVSDKLFGKPQNVHYVSGRYQLVFYNELLKSTEFVWLDQIKGMKKIDVNEQGKYYPGLHEIDGKEVVVDVRSFISENRDELKGTIHKIVYKNLKEQIVSRYIRINKIGQLKDEDPFYLNSYCYLRQAEREFRSDRILSMRTIEDDQLNEFLSSLLE